MKKLAIMVLIIFTVQSFLSPVIAGTVPVIGPESVDADGTVSGKATLKVIGPLHISEGIAIMRDNEIDILSDTTDPIREAELSGRLVHAHAVGDGPARRIKGVAYFTKGYSIAALDATAANESIQVTDGATLVGHILATAPDSLRIETSDGVKVIQIRSVTAIESPRAFEFSIAANDTPSGAGGGAMSAVRNQITFNSTYTPQQNNVPIALHASTTHKQLAERHLKRRLLTAAVIVTAVGACIAFPFSMALFTQRPNR